MHHFDSIAFMQQGGRVLGARDDLFVALDRDQRVAEPKRRQESRNGGLCLHVSLLSVDDQSHRRRVGRR